MTNKEIIEIANELAGCFALMDGYTPPDGFRFYEATTERYKRFWRMAVTAFELIAMTDVWECIDELDELRKEEEQ